MAYPNLIIAGAPKCGTSSLFRWLADHPQACGSSIKETFYLMDEGNPLLRPDSNYHRHGLQNYQRYFEACPSGCKIIFEATTHYIYQRTAVDVLSQLRPLPQIVFVLRKPSERVYSSFQYSKNNLATVNRDVSFSQFVSLVRKHPDSPLINKYAGASAYVLKKDISYSRYIEYISSWVERFGRERVHVLLFEEMRENPHSFMRKLALRTGIDPAFYDGYEFPVRNETVRLKSLSLHRRARKLNEAIPPGKLKDLLKHAYLKAQSGQKANGITPEDRQALSELEQEFKLSNQRLTSELGLNLSAWD